jgi:hypothetical protein
LYTNGTAKINGTSSVSGGGDGFGRPFHGFYDANATKHVFVVPFVVCFFPDGVYFVTYLSKRIPYLLPMLLPFTGLLGGLDQDLGECLLT